MIIRDRVAFSGAVDGDQRLDIDARRRLAAALGVPLEWASVRQIHSAVSYRATEPGPQGEGDAMWTDRSGLPLAVFTADCLGVALLAEDAVGLAHSGWRGTAGGVVPALADRMAQAGHEPVLAVIGPGIGPCCFEVGPEVAEQFDGHVTTTTWGSTSVDLPAAVATQLAGIEVDVAGGCTRHDDAYFSHRRNGTKLRQVSLVWMP